MKTYRCNLLLAAAGLAWATVAQADPAAGQARAATACAVCHGPQGLAMQPSVPNLAGQSEIYLVEQLRNYRSGKRHHEVMSVIAKPLTDADIDNLAQWYASIAIQIEPR